MHSSLTQSWLIGDDICHLNYTKLLPCLMEVAVRESALSAAQRFDAFAQVILLFRKWRNVSPQFLPLLWLCLLLHHYANKTLGPRLRRGSEIAILCNKNKCLPNSSGLKTLYPEQRKWLMMYYRPPYFKANMELMLQSGKRLMEFGFHALLQFSCNEL